MTNTVHDTFVPTSSNWYVHSDANVGKTTGGSDSTPAGVFSYRGAVATADVADGSAGHMTMMLDSMLAMMPQVSPQDLQAALTYLQGLLQETETQNTAETEQNQTRIQEAVGNEIEAQIKDAEAKLQQAAQDDAQAKKNSEGEAGAEIAGGILEMILGGILCACGAPEIGALMIAGGAVMAVSGANDELQAATGHGIGGSIAEDCHDSSGEVNLCDQAISDTLTAVGIAIAAASICGGVTNLVGLVASLARVTATAVADAGSTAVDVVTGTTEASTATGRALDAALEALSNAAGRIARSFKDMKGTAQLIEKASGFSSALVQTSTSGVNVDTAILTRDSTDRHAEAEADSGAQTSEQAEIDQINSAIQSVVQSFEASTKAANQALKDVLTADAAECTAILSVQIAA